MYLVSLTPYKSQPIYRCGNRVLKEWNTYPRSPDLTGTGLSHSAICLLQSYKILPTLPWKSHLKQETLKHTAEAFPGHIWFFFYLQYCLRDVFRQASPPLHASVSLMFSMWFQDWSLSQVPSWPNSCWHHGCSSFSAKQPRQGQSNSPREELIPWEITGDYFHLYMWFCIFKCFVIT